MGFEKMVNELDVKEAARLGMHTKPLTVVQVQKHLEDLGIEPEFGTHSHIRGLSGARLGIPPANSPLFFILLAAGRHGHFMSSAHASPGVQGCALQPCAVPEFPAFSKC